MGGRNKRYGYVWLLAGLLIPSPTPAGGDIWEDVPGESLAPDAETRILPDRYRLLAMDRRALGRVLADAPLERTEDARERSIVLSLPLPDGGFGRFQVEESPILAPELAARYQEIRTFRGRGLDDPTATARLDHTPAGFHAMILSASGTVYIDPFLRNDTVHHVSYHKRDYRNFRDIPFRCETVDEISPDLESAPEAASGATLRTYRLAVAATGEYTAFHGGSVLGAMAEIVTAMNRVNGIYERDVAIRMELVANNDDVIYTNGATDPYNNGNGFLMLSQNQSNLDTVIGSANYDIGHVFSTGGGGIAGFGVACISGQKAQGVTGLPVPTGDPFYVDYVAHEMGHQWRASHTFNGDAGSCSGNRSASSAYEPGSGTTIMAYAGICDSQNIQSNSDDHFHTRSFDQIVAYSSSGSGSTCAVPTSSGNTAPVVDAGPDHTIPAFTPFTLCGSATDLEDAGLTYTWEQFNLGPAGDPNSPSGDAPIFRSFTPSASPCRTFPQWSDILANTQTIGEILPSYGRTLTFRLTVRDNHPGTGGVDLDAADVTVTDLAGPFRVTYPDTAVTLVEGGVEVIMWDVAGTDAPPVNCALVDVLLSVDGGATFPTVLAAGTPNDGSEALAIPIGATTTGRIQVACSDNIFFDVSNVDFAISDTVDPVGTVPDGDFVAGPPLTVDHAPFGNLTLTWGASCDPADADYAIYEGTLGLFDSHVPLDCSTGNTLTQTFLATPGSTYYLVVPRNSEREGSYGFEEDGTPRLPGAGACVPQLGGACDP